MVICTLPLVIHIDIVSTKDYKKHTGRLFGFNNGELNQVKFKLSN